MKKLLFIINPCAGTRKVNRYVTDIISVFNRAGYSVTTYVTAAPKDCTSVVEQQAAQMDLVVCAGGDGTFNETVTGMLRSGADIPIGYIPAGTTNDFASSLHLPANIMQAAELAVTGTAQRYDIGRFGDRFFTYVASFGAFTRASYATPQNIKNALGHTAYILEGIQELSQIRNAYIRFELDTGEVIHDNFIFGAICNSTSVGGILTLDPEKVDMQDGKFELLLVRMPRDLIELHECIRALTSQKYNCSVITLRSASEIKITTSNEMNWTLDGEREQGHDLVTAINLHSAIQLVSRGPGK